jgi:hypothetical protein
MVIVKVLPELMLMLMPMVSLKLMEIVTTEMTMAMELEI